MRRIGSTIKWLAVALGCAGLTACGTFSSDDKHPAQDIAASQALLPDHYENTSWELVRWVAANGSVRNLPLLAGGQSGLTLEFDRNDPEEGARVSGFAGCNRYFGSYQHDINGFVVAELGSTRMACSSPELAHLEQDYLRGLSSVASATLEPPVQPRHLVLVLADGDVLSFARRADSSVATSSLRQVYIDDRKVPCVGVGPQFCYRVRDSQELPWQLFYGEIEGFAFEPGTSYRLRVREQQDAMPPADAPAVIWHLDAILEQRSVVEHTRSRTH